MWKSFAGRHPRPTCATLRGWPRGLSIPKWWCQEEGAVKGFLERSKAKNRLLEADDRFLRLPSSPGSRYMQLRRLRAEAGRAVASWAKTVVQAIGKELEREAAEG